MYINYINILLHIILYFHFVSSYDKGIIVKKEEVLKITNEFYISFYCKDDICVSTDYDYSEKKVTIPDKNGNRINYIVSTCSESKIKQNKCSSEECNSDSQCLSNKCFNHHCAFNEDTPIIHCDSIYSSDKLSFNSRISYMYCGKPYGDKCQSDDECSSRICTEDGTCNMQSKGPSDSDGTSPALFISFTIVIIIVIIIIIYCFFKKCYSNSV